MNLLILKTNINTKKMVNVVKILFNNHKAIANWNIDVQDIDHVLRIEAQNGLSEKEVIDMIKTKGFYCDYLPD